MNAGHEQRDADVISLFGVAIVLFLSSALICGAMWGLMRFLAAKEAAHEAPPQAAATAGAFPPPRLEAQPAVDLQKFRTSENALLDSYGWVDRNAGIARIPIDRAMQLIVERGLPDVGAGQTPLQLMQARPQEARSMPSPPP